MAILQNITGTVPVAAAHPAPDTARIRSTAQQFEALLIGALLKTSREAGSSGWLGTGDDDQAGQIGMEVGEQEFARMLAASGGLGLSRTIEAGMRREAAAERAVTGATPPGTTPPDISLSAVTPPGTTPPDISLSAAIPPVVTPPVDFQRGAKPLQWGFVE